MREGGLESSAIKGEARDGEGGMPWQKTAERGALQLGIFSTPQMLDVEGESRRI